MKTLIVLICITTSLAAMAQPAAKRLKPVGASGGAGGLSAQHQRMFCGDPDGDLSAVYAKALHGEVDRQIARGSPDTSAALAALRVKYCGHQPMLEEVKE